MRVICGIVAVCCFLGSVAAYAVHREQEPHVLESPLSGGETTVFNQSRDAFAKPAANLPTEQLRDFAFGNRLFNTNWVTAPASVTSLDGLGPTFNRVSCSGCHFKDGRGRPPLEQEKEMLSMLLRLSVPGVDAHGGPKPHPAYGGQLNPFGIQGINAEGKADVTYTEKPGQFADGERYSLRVPHYRFRDLNFGPMGEETMVSPRVAPAVMGLGLLEAVPEETILSLSDPDDRNKDGISGRPNRVWDAVHQREAMGRFGWKANQPSLRQQDLGAMIGDIGISSSLFPDQNCPEPQTACRKAPSGGIPELSDAFAKKLVFYSQTLAPPARRDVSNEEVKSGARLFESSGCASCHTPKLTTGEAEVAALSHQVIQPFTDLLLHDMGEALADHRPDFAATGREWRTPPLWGIGLQKTVNRHSFFLHDGRARDLTEAVLWHGGEAENAKERFRQMNKTDRAALIRFLESL